MRMSKKQAKLLLEMCRVLHPRYCRDRLKCGMCVTKLQAKKTLRKKK